MVLVPKSAVATSMSVGPKRRRRRKNPSFSVLDKPVELLKDGSYALLGLVGTRQIPQLVLKEKNTGWVGYVANAATAVMLAYGAGKFLDPESTKSVLIGGGTYLVNRILTEQISPIGKYVALSAGVGDTQAAGTMGRITPAYFPLPVVNDRNGNPIIPKAILDAIDKRIPPPAPVAAGRSTMSGLVNSITRSRFAQ